MPEDYFVPKARARAEGCPYDPNYALRLSKVGRFPLPVRLSRQRVGWLKSQLVAYLQQHNPVA